MLIGLHDDFWVCLCGMDVFFHGFSFLSGVIFFSSYAPDTMAAPIYSLAYNGSYLGAEATITIIILALPPVSRALAQVKQMALEE